MFGRRHHNYSGKHTGMLLLAAALGLAEFTPPPMKNAAGLAVGQMVPVVMLT